MGNARPKDNLDFCARKHDECWDKADGSNVQCVMPEAASASKDACDARFSACLRALPQDPAKWPIPPNHGGEFDANLYRRGGEFLGDHRFFRH